MTTKRRKAPARKPAATALARRPGGGIVGDGSSVPVPIAVSFDPEHNRLVVGAPQFATEHVPIGDVGLHQVKLTDREERSLARPVQYADVSVKADGTPYLSHPVYTKWFNRAFGRMRWAMVSQAKPARSGTTILVPFTLYVHGCPVANAIGEQEHGGNRDLSYGDSLEATYASGLRRLAKRIGVGLELWDEGWARGFRAKHCVCVNTPEGRQWRRKDGAPFEGEGRKVKGNVTSTARFREVKKITRVGRDGRGRGQLGRLFQIMKHAGREHDEVKAYIKGRYGLNSTKDITTDIYDDVIAAIEHKGPMPLTREAGEEG